MKDRLLQVPVLGTVLRMQERYTDDAADALAASIGFFGFLSLFPLLAVVLAVVGATVGGSFIEQQRLVNLISSSVPALSSIVGGDSQVSQAVRTISEQSGTIGVVGGATFLFAGLRIANGAQQACAVVFRREVPSGLAARGKQLVALAVCGTVALAGSAVTSTVGASLGATGVAGTAATVTGITIGFALDVGLFLLAYRLFTAGDGPAWSVLWPGAVLAGAGWTVLKLVGSSYVASQASSAESTYGALGSIIALLLLFYLAGRVFLYGAELAALLGGLDDRHLEVDLVGEAEQVPWVAPAPRPDTPPEPGDAARLALSGVLLAAAAVVVARVLED